MRQGPKAIGFPFTEHASAAADRRQLSR